MEYCFHLFNILYTNFSLFLLRSSAVSAIKQKIKITQEYKYPINSKGKKSIVISFFIAYSF